MKKDQQHEANNQHLHKQEPLNKHETHAQKLKLNKKKQQKTQKKGKWPPPPKKKKHTHTHHPKQQTTTLNTQSPNKTTNKQHD